MYVGIRHRNSDLETCIASISPTEQTLFFCYKVFWVAQAVSAVTLLPWSPCLALQVELSRYMASNSAHQWRALGCCARGSADLLQILSGLLSDCSPTSLMIASTPSCHGHGLSWSFYRIMRSTAQARLGKLAFSTAELRVAHMERECPS